MSDGDRADWTCHGPDDLLPGEPIMIPHLVLHIVTVLGFLYFGHQGIRLIVREPVLLEAHATLEERRAPSIGIEKKVGALERRVAENKKSPDAEIRSLSTRADELIDTGDLDNAEMLVGAADIKKVLSSQSVYTIVDGRVVFPNGWDTRNIISVTIPQLSSVPAVVGQRPQVHIFKDAANQLRSAFSEIEVEGVSDEIKLWCGAYAPRTVAHAENVVSAHAFGIAFDVNCNALQFGQNLNLATAPRFRRIVETFRKHGFLWGGHFRLPDPMHFELYKISRSTEG